MSLWSKLFGKKENKEAIKEVVPEPPEILDNDIIEIEEEGKE
jgi:hypothetical protein